LAARLGAPSLRPAEVAGPAVDPTLTLRTRIAEQVARLQDEPAAAPLRAPLQAGADAQALPAASWSAGPTAPRVDITIGSIAIMLTSAPAVPVPRVAAPAAGPAVQSLDAYLSARQRRGGAT
jgi:hypothetical protein